MAEATPRNMIELVETFFGLALLETIVRCADTIVSAEGS
jgi:hypothetical protein